MCRRIFGCPIRAAWYATNAIHTLFNRRHHCRLCGRIFCAKCTSNWIPTPSSEPKIPLEEWDRIRVCNYCFKQWQQGLTTHAENGVQVPDLDLSSSPSANSFISTKSSGTCDSSSMTFVSLPRSAGLSQHQSPRIERNIDRQSIAAAMNYDHDMEIRGQNLSQDQLLILPCRLPEKFIKLWKKVFKMIFMMNVRQILLYMLLKRWVLNL